MINIEHIKWIYQHFGVVMALRSAVYDILADLAYICYCITLPIQFVWILYRVSRKDKLMNVEKK